MSGPEGRPDDRRPCATPRPCPAPPFPAWLGAALLAVALLAGESPASAQPASLAPTPPMGWNSWDAYGTAVREDQVKANADAMAATLARYGWRYIVVDIQWYQPTARRARLPARRPLAHGRVRPAAAGGEQVPVRRRTAPGFKPLADYVHARGLQVRHPHHARHPAPGGAGEPADRGDAVPRHATWRIPPTAAAGTPTCGAWTSRVRAAQAYYDGIARLYASWGVDFVKADDMGDHLFQPSEIAALRRALDRTGRPIVLSISPGPAPLDSGRRSSRATRRCGGSRTTSGTTGGSCAGSSTTRATGRRTSGIGQTWPDADMLPFGRLRLTDPAGAGTASRLTAAEQRTVMTLWSIIRSPLILGGDVPTLDSATLALLTNPEVLGVNQQGRSPRQVLERSRPAGLAVGCGRRRRTVRRRVQPG